MILSPYQFLDRISINDSIDTVAHSEFDLLLIVRPVFIDEQLPKEKIQTNEQRERQLHKCLWLLGACAPGLDDCLTARTARLP